MSTAEARELEDKIQLLWLMLEQHAERIRRLERDGSQS